MNEKIASELIDQISVSNRKYSMIVHEIKQSGGWDDCGFEKDKLLQMMALSFDILDTLGQKYPQFKLDENGTEH
ncbi:hypothetical protein NBRC116583_07980 [Arenicella sp. 4NH20-0111]|uniref:hypothetical protein n=1 Tax=Arenicella sp. 4NH20-0111 TaxID=3127648 RepID=UPI003103C749